MKTQRVFWTVITAIAPLFLFWLSGAEFERSGGLSAAVATSMFLGAWQWAAPWWGWGNRL